MANTVAGLSPVWAPISSPFNRNPISSYKPRLLSYKENPISTLHRSQSYKPRVLDVVPKQRNWLCSVFGSLTDGSGLNPEEESNDSSEILNYQEEVCLWSLLAIHVEKEQNGLLIDWLMNVALSLFNVEDVFSFTNWLIILVLLLSMASEKPPRIRVPIKFNKLNRMLNHILLFSAKNREKMYLFFNHCVGIHEEKCSCSSRYICDYNERLKF